jgi:hypothetical protein
VLAILLIALIIAVWWAFAYTVVRLKRRQYDRSRTLYERRIAVAGSPETAVETWRAQHDPWLATRGFFPSMAATESVQYQRRALSGFMIGFAILFFPIGTLIAFRLGRDADTVSLTVQRTDSGALVHLSGEIGLAAHNLLQDLPGDEHL